MDSQLINVFLLGLAFMILFTAFQTTTMIQQSVIEGVQNETINGNSFQGSGYISLAISWSSFAVVNLFAPAVIPILGAPISMLIGACTNLFYVVSFVSPKVWSFYLVSVLVGVGGGLLWTGEGTYLAINSDEHTISRNAGIFWALWQFSVIPGNLYVYLSVKTEMITRSIRYPLFSAFSVVCAISLVVFSIMVWRFIIERRRLQQQQPQEKVTWASIKDTLTSALRLLKTKNILLLLVPFAYTGVSLTFFSNVYPTCIGHYIKYGDQRKRLMGLHGLLVGIGEILGGGLFGFITKPKTASQRALIVLIGFILQIISCCSIFLNIPFDAAAQETDTKPYVDMNSLASQVLTFITSFLLGLVDSALSTQLNSVVAERYKATSTSAFAIYQLFQGIAAATAYLYAGSLSLEFQLLIIVILLIITTITFIRFLFNEKPRTLSTVAPVLELKHSQHATHCQNSI